MTGTVSPINRLAPILGCVALLASCGPEPHGVDATSRAISGGRLDYGHPAVGELVSADTNGDIGLCTATLIGPLVALTAAHCLVQDAAEVSWADFHLGGIRYPVYGWTIHPEWDAGSPLDGTSEGFDLAVLHFRTVVAGALPVTLAEYPPRVGHSVQVVGFGITDETDEVDDSAVKRVVELGVAQVDPLLLVLAGDGLENSCRGDSGGPHLGIEGGREVLVGLTSSGTICGEPDSLTFGPRVDAHREWIAHVVALGAPAFAPRDDAAGPPMDCALGSEAPSFPSPLLGPLLALLWLRRASRSARRGELGRHSTAVGSEPAAAGPRRCAS